MFHVLQNSLNFVKYKMFDMEGVGAGEGESRGAPGLSQPDS